MLNPKFKLVWSFMESAVSSAGVQQINFGNQPRRGIYRVVASCVNGGSSPGVHMFIRMNPDTRPQGVTRSAVSPGTYGVGADDTIEFYAESLVVLEYSAIGTDAVASVRVEFYELN